MNEQPFRSLEDHFEDMPDPRVIGRCDHVLIEIIIIAICAVLCGAETWEEVEEFGKAKEGWLRQFLELRCGIPSHDTFRRVFSLLDGQVFQARFIQWVEGVFRITRGQVIAVDGKTLRRSHHRRQGKEALQLVEAWATANGLVLGQRKVETGTNEITTIPALLETLFVKGCIVTIDAIGCQKDIAETIILKQADYVLALKGNQESLYEDVVAWFNWAQEKQFRNISHTYHQTITKGHGRIEIRRCWALNDSHAFEMLGYYERWPELKSIVMVERERHIGDQRQIDTAYFISSLSPDAKNLLACVRNHWHIENSLHWSLDLTFREDDARLRVGDGAENFAILRRMALNLLKHHPAKASLKRKRFRAALDDSFLLELLTQV